MAEKEGVHELDRSIDGGASHVTVEEGAFTHGPTLSPRLGLGCGDRCVLWGFDLHAMLTVDAFECVRVRVGRVGVCTGDARFGLGRRLRDETCGWLGVGREIAPRPCPSIWSRNILWSCRSSTSAWLWRLRRGSGALSPRPRMNVFWQPDTPPSRPCADTV